MLTIGASHRTVNAGTLGELKRSAELVMSRLRDTALGRNDLPVRELAVLATCNRVEVYAVAEGGLTAEAGRAVRREVFDAAFGSDHGDASYELQGDEALRHLCRVATGLDSMVVGEHQISGQVRRAFREVICSSDEDQVLVGAAAAARAAVRRVRAETDLGRYPASVSSVAVDLASDRLGGLAGRRALVVGAGKAGFLVCKALEARGLAALTVVNRSLGRARDVASEMGAEVASLAELPGLLAREDLVVTATGADDLLLSVPIVEGALRERTSERRPLLVIDLALPRDVDPAVGALAGVELMTLEDVKTRVDRHLSLRRDSVASAEAVVDEVVREAIRRRDAPNVEELIGDLRRSIEDIRSLELERWLESRGGAGPPSREELDQLTRSIVNKALHGPMIRLRSAGLDGDLGEALSESVGALGRREGRNAAAPAPSAR